MKKLNMGLSFATVSAAGALVLWACGQGGTVISNTSKLQSTILIGTNQYGTQTAPTCAASATQCTPSAFTGRVYAAGVMLGEAGASSTGPGGFSMTFLAASDEIINRPDEGKTGSTEFNLGVPVNFSGKIAIPAETQMPANPVLSEMEITPDYMDATFAITGHGNAAFNKTWTVRTIFVNSDTIDGLAVTGGDMLLKESGGEFQWCDSSGCSATRPTTPHRLSTVVDGLERAPTQDGNPNYANYSINFPTPLSTDFATISDTTRLWTIDINIENAITWTAAPSTFTAIEDILANFTLPEEISATLTIGETGAVTPATR
jgi:hypothetical protein